MYVQMFKRTVKYINIHVQEYTVYIYNVCVSASFLVPGLRFSSVHWEINVSAGKVLVK